MPKHLTKVKDGWKYQRAVPVALRPATGFNTFVKYLGKAYSLADAERARHDLDIEADAIIKRLRGLTPDQLEAVIKHGGIRKVPSLEDTASATDFYNAVSRDLEYVDPSDTASYVTMIKSLTGGRYKPTDAQIKALPGKRALALHAARKNLTTHRDAIKDQALSFGDANLREDRGLGSLLKLSKSNSSKGLARTRLYLARFIEHLGGDREPHNVSQSDVVSWRNAMQAGNLTVVNQAQILGKVSALFSTAVSDGLLDVNPFAGVRSRGKVKKISDKKRAFKPAELKGFVAKASKHSDEFALLVHCLIFTGARSSELCGLRVRDVRRESGVLVFDINDEVRSVKNAVSVRLIPVASILAKRIEALKKGRDADKWLFTELPRTNDDSAEHQFQTIASRIVRSVTDDKRLTAHGTRYLYTQTCDAVGLDEQIAYALLGHVKGKDVHSQVYRKRPPVKVLKAGVEKVAEALAAMIDV